MSGKTDSGETSIERKRLVNVVNAATPSQDQARCLLPDDACLFCFLLVVVALAHLFGVATPRTPCDSSVIAACSEGSRKAGAAQKLCDWARKNT